MSALKGGDYMVYITGDRHGDFTDLKVDSMCGKYTKKDIIIILGDAGINYYVKQKRNAEENLLQEEKKCRKLKEDIQSVVNATLFCVHGNHEARPECIEGYQKKKWHGGTVYYQKEYPNILFAKDGEVYDFNGKKYIVIGGAYSIDKMYRLLCGYNWFKDEQPSDAIKKKVEARLEKENWKIHGVLSHTCPYRYEPKELFLKEVDQDKVDKSTEKWLDTIEKGLDYQVWYFGHYHGEKAIIQEDGRFIQMLYQYVDILE